MGHVQSKCDDAQLQLVCSKDTLRIIISYLDYATQCAFASTCRLFRKQLHPHLTKGFEEYISTRAKDAIIDCRTFSNAGFNDIEYHKRGTYCTVYVNNSRIGGGGTIVRNGSEYLISFCFVVNVYLTLPKLCLVYKDGEKIVRYRVAKVIFSVKPQTIYVNNGAFTQQQLITFEFITK